MDTTADATDAPLPGTPSNDITGPALMTASVTAPLDDSLPVDSDGDGEREHGDWVLMRVVGDPDRLVLVFNRNEWACFLGGARAGGFAPPPSKPPCRGDSGAPARVRAGSRP